MSKTKVVFIIIVSVLCSWVFSIFFGRYLEAKISTWPVLNKWKILSPQAPIVITNQQTVRVSDSGDAAQSLNQAKSKLSLIILQTGSTDTVVGGAVNLTSDGAFVTASSVLEDKLGSTYYVMLDDGSVGKITGKAMDQATGLTFFMSDLKNIPVISLAVSKNLSAADKLVFAQSSLTPFDASMQLSFVSSPQTDNSGVIMQSDTFSRSFAAPVPGGIIPGTAILNTNGDLEGLWSGSGIISTDVLKQAQNLYFQNNKSFIRPIYGFTYSIINKGEATILNLSSGALVKTVTLASASQKAGLLAGDVITAVNSTAVNTDNSLEELLQNFKPNDNITFSVLRKGQTQKLTLVAGQAK